MVISWMIWQDITTPFEKDQAQLLMIGFLKIRVRSMRFAYAAEILRRYWEMGHLMRVGAVRFLMRMRGCLLFVVPFLWIPRCFS
jgi:hypothetical protein